MRIVSRAQLWAMPKGTIYHEYGTDGVVDDALYLKEESIDSNDWFATQVTRQAYLDLVDVPSFDMEKAEQSSTADIPMPFNISGRDATYDDEARYLVLSDDDICGFIAVLTSAQMTARSAKPPVQDNGTNTS